FIVADDGKWAVVQQGMCGARKEARRYHWLSERLTSFVDSPHAAIDGLPAPTAIVNLTDHRACAARNAQIALVHDGPDRVVRELSKLRPEKLRPVRSAETLELPFHHEVRAEDVVLRRLRGAIAAAHERGPKDFADLLLTPGVGPRTVFSLALVAEVVHGAPSRFSDPARYSLAHGGKDGYPYPVPLRIYDETIRVMKDAVTKAKLGVSDRLFAIQRLDAEVRRLEQSLDALDFSAFVDGERENSPSWDGMTAMGPATSLSRAG
ncbi:MAG TPA: DUF763 domain-containing protein, partial [Gemmatimonadaceae bacterium]|nr:DUF763 domain-containing protein [Gemmatimonadaceae bacterium]